MKKFTLLLTALVISVTTNLKAQNTVTPPDWYSYEVKTLCENSDYLEEQLAIDNIVFVNGSTDPYYITEIDYDQLVFTADWDSNDDGQTTSIYLTPQSDVSGTFTIEITYYDEVGDESHTGEIEITIASAISLSVEDGTACINSSEFDLNDLVSPKGGEFLWNYETPVENGIFDIDEFVNEYGIPSEFEPEGFVYGYEDEYGCFYEDNVHLNFVTEVPSIDEVIVTNTSCGENNGEVNVAVNMESIYISFWNNGVQNENNISGVPAGAYYFTVLDTLSGCYDKISATVKTDGLAISSTVEDILCKGESTGKISVSIDGGSGNYQTIWSSGHSSTTVTDLPAGVYQLMVKDLETGCITYENIEVMEPDKDLYIYYDQVFYPSSCTANDGVISTFDEANSNGAAPFTFEWNTGATTEGIGNLSSGYYSVTVTDANGCKGTNDISLNVMDAPSLDVWQTKVKNVSCGEEDGSIVLGHIYYNTSEVLSYEWSNGETTPNIYNLSSGEYDLIISQSDGCKAYYHFEITESTNLYSPEICIVSVDTATNTNLVIWEENDFGNTNKTDYYNIYRENAVTGKFEKISSVNYNEMSVFNDVIASPEQKSWKYRISSVNQCGMESAKSPHHKTIHLVMTDIGSDTKKLTWDHYEGLEYFYYNLYRSTDVNGWTLIEGNIPISQLPSYTDVIPSGATEVDYMVEVVPTNGACTADFGKAQDYNSSRSNRPSPIFDPGVGTGDPNNDIEVFENENFKAIVYPNPSSGIFTVEVIESINENLTMSVIGIDGKIYHSQSIEKGINEVNLSVDAGMYIVQIQRENSIETVRIVVY